MDFYPVAIEKLIEEFAETSSVGQKQAQRLTMHILNLRRMRLKNLQMHL